MAIRYSAYRRGPDTVPPYVVDRILVGACAAIWLAVLGVSVAAAVALTDLGRGFHKTASSPHTTWVLYVVILVSALIIAGAIPVLLRARRAAQETGAESVIGSAGAAAKPPMRLMSQVPRTAAERARQPRGQSAQSGQSAQPVEEWSGAAVDRVWLRGTVVLTGTMGAALIAVAAATYLMAVGHDGPSWFSYGLAAIVTAAMPVVELLHVRQLRRLVAERESAI